MKNLFYTYFNIFSYDAVWAEHRINHLPNAEQILSVLCHGRGFILEIHWCNSMGEIPYGCKSMGGVPNGSIQWLEYRMGPILWVESRIGVISWVESHMGAIPWVQFCGWNPVWVQFLWVQFHGVQFRVGGIPWLPTNIQKDRQI